ncbi:MAG: hypothetical protein HOJ09_14725 [Gammaproteobacteria bacterium]|jgi:hypothetical protein|nr:hypothetical protein [Gammaproteobacteria bacterium]MBT6024903.1 hypothetical protein [Gammaproteobacteria bacterium]
MNQCLKYALTVVVAAAAMVAYQYEGKPEQVGLAQQAPSQVPEITSDKTVLGSLPTSAAQAQKAKRRWIAEYSAALAEESLALGQEDIRSYEAVNVTFYNPSTTVCETTDVVTEEGELIAKEVCRDEYKLPRHPYYALDNEALDTLSYGEPLAAQILAERISAAEPEAALKLLLHAAATSEKYGPLTFAAHRTFRLYDPIREINQEDVAMHIALIDVALAMGADPNTVSALKVPDGFVPDKARVQKLVAELKASIAQTQIAVTGSSSLKERFDV